MAVWLEIVCDECSNSLPGRFVSGGRYPVREIEAERKKARWSFKDGNHYCVGCTHAQETGHEVFNTQHGAWCGTCRYDL
jgi:hypothetical protein